jgi:release factor glutamine methyltransferase
VTVAEALKTANETLQKAEISSYRLDSQLLLAHVLEQDRTWITAHDDAEITDGQAQAFNQLIEKRADHVPVVHLTNIREFYGLELYIDDQVLTPRVETETMAEWAIELAPKDARIIDIGTGSGAIALAIATHRPDLDITATEVSTSALQIAMKNAKRLSLSINCIQSNLFTDVTGKFAVVATNLPYLKTDADLMPEVRREPAVALFGGSGDGLEMYREFLQQLPRHLESGGYLFTECDPWQQADLISEAKAVGLSVVKQDYFILGFQNQ